VVCYKINIETITIIMTVNNDNDNNNNNDTPLLSIYLSIYLSPTTKFVIVFFLSILLGWSTVVIII